MGAHFLSLLRDTVDTGAEAFVGKALAVAAPAALACVAAVFLTLAGYGALAEVIGAPEAALSLAALFAALALLAMLLIRMRAGRRRRRAAEAQARLAGELSAVRAILGLSGAVAPLAAFLAAFALARRS